MRGKKIDTEFLTNFIQNCVAENKVSPNQICQEAQNQIFNIDLKIKEVEKLKLHRSKLIDVVSTFNENKKTTPEIAKTLPLFNIKNNHICKYICDLLKENNFKMKNIHNEKFNIHDILFCIKQLVEHKVICKTGDFLFQGPKYHEYTKMVLQEK